MRGSLLSMIGAADSTKIVSFLLGEDAKDGWYHGADGGSGAISVLAMGASGGASAFGHETSHS